MKFIKSALIVLLLIAQTIGLSTLSTPVRAAGATLYTSPSYGTKYVGDKFYVFIYVNTSQATVAYEVNVSASNLTVTGLSVGGSICILYTSPSSYTPTSAHFQCGLPSPGYTGPGGYIGSVVVQGKSPGSGKVAITSGSQVLADDGAGTNILTGTSSSTFTILPPPTAAPSVTSSTHPDQEKWYKNKNVSLSWTGSGSEFSYTFVQSADTTPDQTSEGSGTSKTYENVADGIWYFHVRVKGSGGWSATTSFRVQIDTVPPKPFTPEADPKKDAEKRPVISFATTDDTSGVDHYEIKLDNGIWVTAANPYKIPTISSGKHTISVKAVDKAGNEQIGKVDLSVKNIPAPTIDSPKNGSFFPYSSHILIKGHSAAGYQVKIFLAGKQIAKVKADKDGRFETSYKELLPAGKHTIHAVAINPDEIESPKSNIVNFNLDPRAFVIIGLTIPGVVIYTTLFGSLLIFLIILLLIIFRGRRLRKRLVRILEDLEGRVEKDLDESKVDKKVEEKVEGEFEETEKELVEEKTGLLATLAKRFGRKPKS